jgi:hypothetical protein
MFLLTIGNYVYEAQVASSIIMPTKYFVKIPHLIQTIKRGDTNWSTDTDIHSKHDLMSIMFS